MTDNSNVGIVYILTNECMPNLVKIGMTSRENLDDRLRELYTTGVPMPFECVYACRVVRYRELERALHDAFEPNRVNPNREFFRIKPSQVIGILRLFDTGNITSEVIEELNQQQTEESPADDNLVSHRQPIFRRQPINLLEMGMKEGDILTFVHNPNITCVVKNERKVLYEGVDTFLTPITTQLLNAKQSVQPTPHWEFNGRNLLDIYNDWQERTRKEEDAED